MTRFDKIISYKNVIINTNNTNIYGLRECPKGVTLAALLQNNNISVKKYYKSATMAIEERIGGNHDNNIAARVLHNIL